MQSQGTVKNWTSRGFGFIKPDSSGALDCIVHVSQVLKIGRDSLTVGQRVAYDLEPDNRDPSRFRAVNLRLIESSATSPADNADSKGQWWNRD